MAHMCVKLSPLSLEWPQSTGTCTKCMLSHDPSLWLRFWSFIFWEKGGERPAHTPHGSSEESWRLACGHTARDFCETHGNGLGSARVPRSLPHIW
jgi:hypothetical protein